MAVHAVSRVCLDAAGHITYVLIGQIDPDSYAYRNGFPEQMAAGDLAKLIGGGHAVYLIVGAVLGPKLRRTDPRTGHKTAEIDPASIEADSPVAFIQDMLRFAPKP